ncbi:MAG: hypothetical protein Q4E76_05250 [Tissierellia bacterium]|nr:hypothetical protein [Tissierellia bacterium]
MKLPQDFQEKMARFLSGRYLVYGPDMLHRFLQLVVFPVGLFALLNRSAVAAAITFVILAYMEFRLLSRNTRARRRENEWFLDHTRAIRKPAVAWYRGRKDRENTYFTCPNCHTIHRAPKGKGKIRIRCKHCKEQFEKRV